MAMIKGVSITLYNKVEIGVDAFNTPIFEEHAINVDNVLISPVSQSKDITTTTQLNGKNIAYELSIPKSDNNHWEDCKVEFYGQTWRTVGGCRQWMPLATPLLWNKKIMVERYV